MKRLLILRDRDDDVGASIADGCSSTGWEVTNWPRPSAARCEGVEQYHTVLAYGPHNGSMMSVADLLGRVSPDRRPRFIWWLCENAPDPLATTLRLVAGGIARRMGDAMLGYRDGEYRATPVRGLLSRGHRDRVFGELLTFRRRGLLDRLVVTSSARAHRLRQLGFQPVTVPLGYNATRHGRDLQSRKDIDVLFLGREGAGRRAKLLRGISGQLAAHGIRLVVNGPDQWVQGEARIQLLNRTKVLLNILKTPGDFTGHRLVLGMANKALIVTEPFVDPAPFVAGAHFVDAPTSGLAEAVRKALEDEPRRLEIVGRAYGLLQTELEMSRLCVRALSDD